MPVDLRAQPLAAAEPLSDEEVVERVRAGDTALFEVLMRRHNQGLFRTVRAILRNEAEAEDAMQQTYVAAFTHLGQFTGDAKFSTWLSRIGINEALGRLRQGRRQVGPEEAEDLETRMPTPEDGAANRELGALLEQTIDCLPTSYRQVFMMRLVEGRDTAETAAILGLAEGNVKQRLHRARAMVQQAMEERVGAVAGGVFPFHASRCDRVVAAVMARLAAT